MQCPLRRDAIYLDTLYGCRVAVLLPLLLLLLLPAGIRSIAAAAAATATCAVAVCRWDWPDAMVSVGFFLYANCLSEVSA